MVERSGKSFVSPQNVIGCHLSYEQCFHQVCFSVIQLLMTGGEKTMNSVTDFREHLRVGGGARYTKCPLVFISVTHVPSSLMFTDIPSISPAFNYLFIYLFNAFSLACINIHIIVALNSVTQQYHVSSTCLRSKLIFLISFAYSQYERP